MQKYTDLGYTTFDMADIYGPAEVIFGKFYRGVSCTCGNSYQLAIHHALSLDLHNYYFWLDCINQEYFEYLLSYSMHKVENVI